MSIHFWEALCFLMFVILIYKPAKKIFIDSLDGYSKRVSLKIKDAENLRLSAEKAIKFYKEQEAQFNLLAQKIQDSSNENIIKITEEYKTTLEQKIKTKKLLHTDKLTIYDQEEMNKIKTSLISKAIVITQMYLRDHGKISVTKPQIQEALHVIKSKKFEAN